MQNDYEILLCQARSGLENARDVLADEIARYPTPISGCDVQFNHLLADRQRIAAALEALAGDVFIATPRMTVRRTEAAFR